MIKKGYRVLETISTVNGTLYKDDLVDFENIESNGDWRVKDKMGKIWYIKEQQLSSSAVRLSKESKDE